MLYQLLATKNILTGATILGIQFRGRCSNEAEMAKEKHALRDPHIERDIHTE